MLPAACGIGEAGVMADFIKQRTGAPPGFFAAEASGLAWLAEPDVVPVVNVIDHDEQALRLERIDETTPNARSAAEFGRRLARLHDSGAPAFGWAPAEPAWFGPLDSPFEVGVASCDSFTDFWVELRLTSLASAITDRVSAEDDATITSAIESIATGAFDGISGQDTEPPARVHGDLWAGNLMWTPEGCTLIDPAAHGGHRLEDLALLALFGSPFLDEIYTGYAAEHPLPEGWQSDLPAHSFFALLAHVKLFGAGFRGQTLTAARAITARAAELGA